MENRLKICIYIELALFFYRIYGYAVSLQVQSSFLVVVPFEVYYIINIPIKHIVVIISSDSIMIRNRNVNCWQSATK